MSRVQANCPSCGAVVKFRVGASLVAVCEFCRSVVGRSDRAIEDVGKVAELAETQSPLQLGLKGRYDGKAFEIVGRCQYQHEAGGVWDEWYCAFNNKRWGWLAEAQGRFSMNFAWHPPEGLKLPEREKLQIGRRMNLPDVGPVTVAEIGSARAAGAEGELPFELKPGESHLFVDLQGEGGLFGTIDYGQELPVAFIGKEIPLADLGFGDAVRPPDREARQVAALSVSCPHCGGALELRAPDQTQRVVCPYCRSMLDCDQGALRYLSTLEIQGRKPVLELGSKGTLDGVEYTVLGFMTRSVTYAGVDYFWDEYLLYQPQVGFRWLVRSDNHWNFVRPLSAGEVHERPMHLEWQGKTFKLYQRATAEVRFVLGEFYWKVQLGEQVLAADYIHPPEMISVEDSVRFFENEGTTGAERNVSLGTYLTHEVIERAFGVSDLPRPEKVAPNQPFPHTGIYQDALLALAALFVLGMLFLGTSRPREVYRAATTVPPKSQLPVPAPVAGQPLAGQPVPGHPVPGPPIPGPPALGGVQPAAGQPAPGPAPLGNALPPQGNALEPVAVAGAEGAVFFSQQPIELHARQPVQVTVSTSVTNSWVYVEGDFFNEETGLVQTFEIPVEFYTGYEGGEHWSEGNRRGAAVMSALPTGKYTLRLEVQSGSAGPEPVTVVVSEGNFRILNFVLALLALGIVPLFVGIRHYLFERARWEESDYSPYASSSDDDE